MHVLLNGTIRIPRAEQAAILPVLREHIELTLAEPGCLWFRVEKSDSDPNIYIVDEGFINEESFAFHQERSQASKWGKASAHLERDFTKTVEP